MRTRMEWADSENPPALMDVAIEEPIEVERAYLVVGVEEHRDSPAVWWLVMERIEFENAAVGAKDRLWHFHKLRR